MDNTELIKSVEKIAKDTQEGMSKGHYSIFSFTTNYKGCYGTIHPDFGQFNAFMNWLPAHGSLQELLYFMAENPSRYTYNEENLYKAVNTFNKALSVAEDDFKRTTLFIVQNPSIADFVVSLGFYVKSTFNVTDLDCSYAVYGNVDGVEFYESFFYYEGSKTPFSLSFPDGERMSVDDFTMHLFKAWRKIKDAK